MSGRVTSLTLRPREVVLREVREVLRCEGFPPDELNPAWGNVRRIGRYTNGEHEIIRVSRVARDARSHYITVFFEVIHPNGERGTFGMRFSRPAVKVVVVVHGRLIFSSEHRPALGKWEPEIPRGWISWQESRDPQRAARVVLERKVGKAWTAGLTPFEPIKVGEGPDDSGYHNLIVPVYYFEAENAVELPSWNDARTHRPRAYTWIELDGLEDRGKISDDRTLSALRHVERYLRKVGGGVDRSGSRPGSVNR